MPSHSHRHRNPRNERRKLQIWFGVVLALLAMGVIAGLLWLMNQSPLGGAR
jgi:hypothetical protein